MANQAHLSFMPRTRHEQLRDEAQQFHEQHPEVWEMFTRFAFDRINRGFKNYSAKAVMERVRWETAAGGDHEQNQFKINDHHTAFYSRRFMRMYPQHEGFFRTRKQTSMEHQPTTLPPLGPADFDTGE